MVDAPKVLRDYLAAQSAITSITGTRIYAESTFPQPSYEPATGGSIVFRSRGGRVGYSSKLLTVSFVFKCYDVNEEDSNVLYRTLFDNLHDARGSGLRQARLEIAGQTMIDPLTGWVNVTSFYVVVFCATA